MNKEELAKSKYHGAEDYNCAQAVLAAFRDEAGVSDEEMETYASAGGGRAEGGICGAAFAAKRILKDASIHHHIDALFDIEAGSSYCKRILEKGQLSCKDCVALAARFIVDHLPA